MSSNRVKLDGTVDWKASTPIGRAIKRGEVCAACTINASEKSSAVLRSCKVHGRVYARADGLVVGIMRCPYAPENPTYIVPAMLLDNLGNVDLKRYAAAQVGRNYDSTPMDDLQDEPEDED